MSNLEFHVGAQIVCVDDNWQDTGFEFLGGLIHPQVGSIYTIREIVDDSPLVDIGLLLEEIVNVKFLGRWELSWYAWHFRPVKKTDISQFTQILQTLPKKVREPA